RRRQAQGRDQPGGGREERRVSAERCGPARAATRRSAPRLANMTPVTRAPRDRPIGVFDSGVGGLTVLHELLVALPHEDFVYLGDTARFPYGERTADELERFSLEVAEE